MFSSCGSEIYQELTFHSPHVSKFSFPVRVLSTKFTKLLQDGENETENATNTVKKGNGNVCTPDFPPFYSLFLNTLCN